MVESGCDQSLIYRCGFLFSFDENLGEALSSEPVDDNKYIVDTILRFILKWPIFKQNIHNEIH